MVVIDVVSSRMWGAPSDAGALTCQTDVSGGYWDLQVVRNRLSSVRVSRVRIVEGDLRV